MFKNPRPIKHVFAIFTGASFFCFVLIETFVLVVLYQQKQSELQAGMMNYIENSGQQADKVMAALDSAYYNISNSTDIIPFMDRPIGDRDVYYNAYFSAERLYSMQASDFSMISRYAFWSAMYYKDEMLAFAAKTEPAKLTSIGLVTPRNTACDSVQLVFMGPVYDYLGADSLIEPLGYICFSMQPEAFIPSISSSEAAPIQYVLQDAAGAGYFFDKQLPAQQKQLYQQLLGETTPAGGAVQKGWFRQGSQYIYAYPVQDSGYTLYGITSACYMVPYLFQNLALLLIIGALFSALMLALYYIMFRQIISPVKTLSQRIHNARKKGEDPVTFIAPVDGCVETRALSAEFNKLIMQNNALSSSLLRSTETTYQLAMEKERAEMSHLRSQINPHFLYNTLESIRGMAMERGDQRIADISTAIGKMLRYSIKGGDLVPLKTELELTKAYLKIQQTRFEGRFETIFSVASGAEGCYVCKLLLQPLLENSIQHGFASIQQGGILWVGAKKEDGMLVVTVQDNGAGISEEMQVQLRRQLACDAAGGPQAHIGIANVHRRIRLHWGDAYGVEIESQPHCGTKVVCRLPVITRLENAETQEETADV